MHFRDFCLSAEWHSARCPPTSLLHVHCGTCQSFSLSVPSARVKPGKLTGSDWDDGQDRPVHSGARVPSEENSARENGPERLTYDKKRMKVPTTSTACILLCKIDQGLCPATVVAMPPGNRSLSWFFFSFSSVSSRNGWKYKTSKVVCNFICIF